MPTSAQRLAVDGGTPVRRTPWPARHLFGAAEKQAAIALFDECERSGNVFGYNGPEEQAFEKEFAAFLGGGFADGVNSGSSAVFAALGALRLERGAEVIVPPITDPGGAMPVAMLNLVPILADADPRSYNLGPEQVAAKITKRTRAIVVAHIGGEPVDMDPILALAKQHDLKVVEDCAQSHGARYKGRLVGTLGDIAAFSTMSGKHFATAAQGGVVYTRCEELHGHGRRFADRGKPFGLTNTGGNVMAGLNLNLNDLSAAIGRVQLRKLPAIVAARHRVGEAVKAGLAGVPGVQLGWQPPETYCSYWFLRGEVHPECLTVDKAQFVRALQAEGVSAGLSYRHIQSEAPWYRDCRSTWCPWEFARHVKTIKPLPNAIAVTDRCFNIGVHENFSDQDAQDLVAALTKVEKAYRR